MASKPRSGPAPPTAPTPRKSPARAPGTIRLPAKLVRDLFGCPACGGLLREVVTLRACLHSFCSECVHRHLRTAAASGEVGPKCPACQIPMVVEDLGPARPGAWAPGGRVANGGAVVPDKQIQALLGMLRPIQPPPSAAPAAVPVAPAKPTRPKPVSTQATSTPPQSKRKVAQQEASVPGQIVQHVRIPNPGDEVTFELRPLPQPGDQGYPAQQGRQPNALVAQPLSRPAIRASGALRLVHLQRYVRVQLGLADHVCVDISCAGFSPSSETTVQALFKMTRAEALPVPILYYSLFVS